jgi:DNA-directed RNA polymerase subunit H (RpoH/RPB5)
MDSSCLAIPKVRSMGFIRQMFLDRGYILPEEERKYDTQQKMWQIFAQTLEGHKVMAVFADCKEFGDANDIEDFTSITGRTSDSMVAMDKGKGHTQNTGTDFVKNIESMARAQKFKIVVVVTDFITPQAKKKLLSVKDIIFSHFTYDESGIENMPRHITQPMIFRALKGEERREFIRKNSNYRVELPRYSIDDALVKYFGLQLQDIIYIDDNDRQTASVVEYGYVVEDL